MDEIFDRIKAIKIKRKYLVSCLIFTEILGILIFIWLLKVPLTQKFLLSPAKAYSVISLNKQKRYLVSQGDFLKGKAIPGTKVKALITPPEFKHITQSNSSGDWTYQVPSDLQKGIYRFTFGNFDKSNKLVTFQTYKFRVQSNISLLNFIDSFKKKVSGIFRPVNAQMRTGFIPDLYINAGLPPPHVPITLTEEQRFRFRNYFLPYAYTAAKITGADWRLMAMFSYKEDFITNYLDNCLDGNKDYGPDADYDPNTPCTGWGIPQWQVGWGHYPAQWANEKLAEAVAVMRPGKTIQEIGQEVIDNSYNLDMYATFNHLHEKGPITYKDPITYPERFPSDVTLEEIIEGSQPILNDGLKQKPTFEEKKLVIGTKTCRPFVDANTDPRQDPKDCYMRQLLGVLMKDPAISAYLLALMWKDRYDEQQVINEIKYQWGEGFDLLIASNIIAGFDNEAQGIDFEALTTTPQVTIVEAVQDPGDPSKINVSPVVSQDGSQIDTQNHSLKYQVIPNDSSIYDTLNPSAENNVRGINSEDWISQAVIISGEENCNENSCIIFLPEETRTNPENFQMCLILTAKEYPEKAVSVDCKDLVEIVHNQIPLDQESPKLITGSACPLYPEEGEFECAQGVCKSLEFDCSGGKRWFYDEYKDPQNSCNLTEKINSEGQFSGVSYHYDLTSECGEPEQEEVASIQQPPPQSCEPAYWRDEEPYDCIDGQAYYNRWKIPGGNQCEIERDYGDNGLHYTWEPAVCE